MNLLPTVQQPFHTALAGLVDDPTPYVAMVKPTQDARHGDYQANCAMPLSKVLGKPPREVAQTIIDRLPLGELLEQPAIAGPGFINVRLRSDWLAARVRDMAGGDRLGVEPAPRPRTFVLDFSSPNVAKPMHVGHLRSTIIGDSLTRLLRFLGHWVVTDNHLGDWGLQFGMLLHGYKHFLDRAALDADPVQEMVRLYVHVRKLIDLAEKVEEEPALERTADPEELARSRQHLAAARQETLQLHEGDPENRALWQRFMPWCMGAINPIYERLGVQFDHTLGESFYDPMLADVVVDLMNKGIARESEGAVAIFLAEGEPPALVRYRSGAFTYTTTDLATIRYRMTEWNPDAILYVVDSRQAPHFRNLFAAARKWGYDRVELEHISFGYVMKKPEKPHEKPRPISTREGGADTLGALLDEAVRRAGEVYRAAQQQARERGEEVVELPAAELAQVFEVVGLGAVKYADLSQNRQSDYVFDWDKMLAMDGNTATYMQYAYARNRSIFRRGGVDVGQLRAQVPAVLLETAEERALALQLLRFGDALSAAAAEYKPNVITSYLWDLAKAYSGFFQQCPVLKAPTPELRQSRLLLCDLTARVIQKGLDLLGIRTVERM